MTTFSSSHLQCVVALASFTSTEDSEWTDSVTRADATGFLYAFPRMGRAENNTDASYHLWLITCRHVIQGLRCDGYDEMAIRMNLTDQQSMIVFTLPLRVQGDFPRWNLHPTKDVAVSRVPWEILENQDVQWETFVAGRNVVTRRDAIDLGISEGYTVFLFGFPTGWREGRQDYPIARHGILAQTRGWLKGEHETFLVDGSGFPGNSGGPVIVKSSQVDALIGMVSASKVSLVGTEEHSWLELGDLIEVIPMETINETIQMTIELENNKA